jgi:hypothetical protein
VLRPPPFTGKQHERQQKANHRAIIHAKEYLTGKNIHLRDTK